MPETVLKMATDLTVAMIGTGVLSVDQMPRSLSETHASLIQLEIKEAVTTRAGLSAPETEGGLDWKKSITKHNVTCLECGASFRQLSTRHLRVHNLNSRTYRKKYGMPRTQSLASRDVRAKRQAIVQRVKPWEKSRSYRKQGRGKPPPTSKVKRLKKVS